MFLCICSQKLCKVLIVGKELRNAEHFGTGLKELLFPLLMMYSRLGFIALCRSPGGYSDFIRIISCHRF